MIKRLLAGPLPIILIAALMRLVPHPANFAPVAAMALFGGAYLPKKYALALPLLVMAISDVFLGFHSTILWVYGSYVLIGVLGMRLRNAVHPSAVFFTTVSSSLLFYLMTNFGVWITTGMYEKTWEGLLQCYVMGLPFLRNTLLGDGFYSALFFGGYYLFNKIISHRVTFSSST